jgi:predicted NUDIX family NTP pyrophosphohydrolase
MSAESPPASLPAVPANLKRAIREFEDAVRLVGSSRRDSINDSYDADYTAARSNLENLFLEQQREIERLRASPPTAESQLIEPIRVGPESPSIACEECGGLSRHYSDCSLFPASRPTASPDQDFLKLVDALIDATNSWRETEGSSIDDREIQEAWDGFSAARQSLVDYLEGIRAERDEALEVASELNQHGIRLQDQLSALKEDALRRISGVTWLLVREGRVLMERCPKKAAKLGVGEWFIPGGKIEGDESPLDALYREVGEEWPSVVVESGDWLPILQGSPIGVRERAAFLMQPFVITVRGEIPTHASNGVELRWVPLDEALASPVPQVRMMVAALRRISSSGRNKE